MSVFFYMNNKPIVGPMIGDKQSISLYDSKEKTIKTVCADKDSVDEFLNEHKKLTSKEEKKALGITGALALLGGLAGIFVTKKYKENPYWFNVPVGAFIGATLGSIASTISLEINNPFQKLNDKFISKNKE